MAAVGIQTMKKMAINVNPQQSLRSGIPSNTFAQQALTVDN